MDELAPYLEKLMELSPKMIALKLCPSASMQYHALAGAVYWSDEIPRQIDDMQEDALRILLRYRTTLMLGRPEVECQKFWELAKQSFPTWIGFSESRVSPNSSVLDFYAQKTKRVRKQIQRGLGD